MAITVEDGSVVSGADAFVSVATADNYHTNHGNTDWANALNADKEIAIRRATTFLSSAYSWAGDKVGGRAQSLAWPRTDVYDREGDLVANDEVPQEVVNATCELALRELVTPGTLTPDIVLADKVKREKADDIEVEYANTATSASASIPMISAVNNLISGLLATGSGSGLAGASSRW